MRKDYICDVMIASSSSSSAENHTKKVHKKNRRQFRILVVQRDLYVDLYQLVSNQDVFDTSVMDSTRTTKLLGRIELTSSTKRRKPKSPRSQFMDDVDDSPEEEQDEHGEDENSDDEDMEDAEDSPAAISTNLVATCVSPNGQWIALCDALNCVLFELVPVSAEDNDEADDNDDEIMLRPQAVPLPQAFQENSGLSIVSLSFLSTGAEATSNTLVAVDSIGQVHMINIQKDDTTSDEMSHEVQMEYYSLKFPASVQGTDLVQDQWPRLPIQDVISTQHINGDKTESWMATLRHGSCHAVELYKRIGDSSSINSSYRHIWTIPSLGNGIANRPTSICFFDFPACSADRGAGEGSLAKKLCRAVATA